MKGRLQKIISAAGAASRRAAEEMIAAGRVRVNGAVAVPGQSADTDTDVISIDGVPLRLSGVHTYVMLHKPRGFVTTLHDEKGRRTVAELVRIEGRRLYPVGRLDMYSEGLLLMTDDGDFANAVMHPRGEVEKVYRTHVRGDVAAALPILTAAMEIDGYRIRPAKVNVLGEELLEITIHEGRNRQVRKMCEAAGLKVERLVRVAEGPLRLGNLPLGKWRHLTENEIEMLKHS
ncbi:MAG: rRNA pseudouridine synthase [Ruminococcaceae bacterium]|nr:rRNA pseudouridine synthase [Oscillospiraceae bacterium]